MRSVATRKSTMQRATKLRVHIARQRTTDDAGDQALCAALRSKRPCKEMYMRLLNAGI